MKTLAKLVAASAAFIFSQVSQALVIDGGVVFLNSTDHVLDQNNQNNNNTRSNLPSWSDNFSFTSNEGRTTSGGTFGFDASSTGLQFDVFNHNGIITSTGVGYLPNTGSSDRASAQLQLAFTLTQATDYVISGDFTATGEANNFAGGTFTSITDLSNNSNVFLERSFTQPANSFDYSYGDGVPDNGSRIGTLGPGSYRIVWESQTVDSLFVGGGLAANSTSNFTFQLGEFAAVPAPSALLLFGLGLLGLVGRSKTKLA